MSARLYNGWAFETLNATFPFPQVFSLSPFPLAREPTVTAWRGTTLGRDITCAISLIVPLRFVRRLRNNMAQSLVLYVKSDARYSRRLAAPSPSSKLHIPFISTLRISFRFGRGCPTQSVILRVSKDLAVRRIFFAPLDSSTTLRMTRKNLHFTDTYKSGVGVPPNQKYQADNLAKLRQEFLSVTELSKIFGAVRRTKA